MSLRLPVPGSKSMTQRALIIAALSPRPSRIHGALDCDDSTHLSAILRALGVGVDWRGDRVAIRPSPLVGPGETLFCGNAGTAIRFASCLALVCDGPLLLDGDERMRQRPIGPLGQALAAMNVAVEHPLVHGYPPIGLSRQAEPPGQVSVNISRSSQFASGLLLVAPRLANGLTVELTGEGVSLPYLEMTTRMMDRAGVRVRWQGQSCIQVQAGSYDFASGPAEQTIEPDWSTAAFVLAAGRIADLPVQVPNLLPVGESLQGDAQFARMLEELDRPGRHEFDLTQVPDLIAPLVAAALLAKGPSRIFGAAHTRIKESDRIAVLVRGLRQMGARVIEHPDGLELEPMPSRDDVSGQIDPAGDHRMAMTFGLLSLRWPKLSVLDPGCVSKSYPTFWNTLARLKAQRQGGSR